MSGIKPFLILQFRPEDESSDDEMDAFLKFGALDPENVRRIRIEQQELPPLNLEDYSGIILGGGPSNVSDEDDKKSADQMRYEQQLFALLAEIVEHDIPFLGACYGLGVLAKFLGGSVEKGRYSEGVGAVTIYLTDAAKDDVLTVDLPQNFRAFAGHKESCQEVPPGATLLAGSDDCPVHMIRVKQNIYATQFHPELDQDGLALRINVYKHAGYFPPEDAEMLIALSKHEDVMIPGEIMRRFVERYSTPD